MDRIDPLEDDSHLTHHGPGHAPALWLALPLLTGCLAATSLDATHGGRLLVGSVALIGALVAAGRSVTIWMGCAALAGAALGATWHGVRAARMAPWVGERGQADLFVEVDRVESLDGERWRLIGWVQTGPPDTRRRRVLCDGRGARPGPGGVQVISGLLAPCGDPAEPRGDWLRSQGISLRLGAARLAAEIEPAGTWARLTDDWSHKLESGLRELAWEDPRGARLLAATMLGRTRLLDDSDREAFATTGTLHLFAISGLHIAGMALAMTWVGRRCRVPPRIAGSVALVLLWVYVEVTGGAPSARRAWIMAACILACTLARRRPNPIQGLATACVVTLVLDPEAATDAGFQLSYASVAGILLVGGPAARALARPALAERLSPTDAITRSRRIRAWLRARLLEGFAISLAASTAATAITLGTFGTLCPGGVLANLLLVPLSGPPVVLGMASITLGLFGWLDPLRQGVNTLAAGWLHGMAQVAEWLACIPGMTLPAYWREPLVGTVTTSAVLLTMLLQPQKPAGGRLLAVPLLVLLAGLVLGASLG
ncbi:MAG: ComEC/Rec2 family competence protein [Opitutales bacterium]